MELKGTITEITIDGKKFPAMFTCENAKEKPPDMTELVKEWATFAPRALASFHEAAFAPLLKPIDWKKLTEVKTIKWRTGDFVTFDELDKGDDGKLRERVADRIKSFWSKDLSNPIDDIRSIVDRAATPRPKPQAPKDAMPIAGDVSLRHVHFTLDRVEVLRKGDEDAGSIFSMFAMRQSEVRVHFTTPDRTGGTPLKLFYRQQLDDALLEKDPTYLPAMIRNTIRLAYMHEVDEMLYFQGTRFTEPHPENAWIPDENGPGSLTRAREDKKYNAEIVRRIEDASRVR